MSETSTTGRVDLDWKNLGFSLLPTDYNLLYRWRDGGWSAAEVRSSAEYTLPLGATALHYGQSVFEGLKAFETGDGRAVMFRPDQNAARMARGARKLLMQAFPEDLFVAACRQVVKLNRRYLPPSDSGASLYLRPLLFGSSGLLGVRPADEYIFGVFCTPVGPYFGGELAPIKLAVEEETHRAAPLGVGDVKAAGNYAAGMRAVARAKAAGFDNVLYLDARESKYIDETGATNFFGIRRDGDGSYTYVTPRSLSILPSITNDSLMTIARDLGLRVEQRPVAATELTEFVEAGCCGTAAVITPVKSVQLGQKHIEYGQPGEVTRALYKRLTEIQRGNASDDHNWVVDV
ncbi:MAG: branched-chain amino acid aminotransferase [Myxococcota bacterium]|jgi:branched-chain amino acid aminotransferase